MQTSQKGRSKKIQIIKDKDITEQPSNQQRKHSTHVYIFIYTYIYIYVFTYVCSYMDFFYTYKNIRIYISI
jgi:hypothetical protein